jgi:hypothetical protein
LFASLLGVNQYENPDLKDPIAFHVSSYQGMIQCEQIPKGALILAQELSIKVF